MALAHALTEPVRAQSPHPLAVLEAGAGTGAITRALIPQLSRGSRLDVVEANPRFAARLDKLVTTHPDLSARSGQAAVHQSYVEEFDTPQRYDVIISGLPLGNFAPEQVERMMSRYMDLLHLGGTLTYFAYLGTRRARSLTASRAGSRRHTAVKEVMAAYQRTYATNRWTVWVNLPPPASGACGAHWPAAPPVPRRSPRKPGSEHPLPVLRQLPKACAGRSAVTHRTRLTGPEPEPQLMYTAIPFKAGAEALR